MTGTAVATYEERWAQDAKKAAEVEPLATGTWLSIKGGRLSIGDETMPGDQVAVIVLDSVMENTYYGDKYDPDNLMPPICYAMARDGGVMFPHTDMQKDLTYFQPQHVVKGQVMGCDGCPMNEWGSAAQGRGKACQNRRRLAVIPAGFYTQRRGSRDLDLELFTDPEHFRRAEIAHFKIPVTSVKNWASYVHQLASGMRRPPHGVVTRLAVHAHPKFQHEVTFDPIEQVPDELAEIIIQRHDAAVQQPLVGYAPPDEERRSKQQRGGGFRR